MAEETKPTTPTGSGQGNTMAVLAHVLGLLTSFVGPLVLYLINKDAKPLVQSQTKEALNFQITLAIGWVIGSITLFIFTGRPIMAAIGIVNVIFSIIAAMAASKGEDYKYPFSWRVIK